VKAIFSATNAIVAIIAGVLVLLGYFFPDILGWLQALLLQWAVIIAAFALILGVLNLFSVHGKKIRTGQPGAGYSIVLLIALIATILVVGITGPTSFWSLWLFNHVQVPVEISLVAILAVVLVYASARLLSRRMNWFTVLFLAVVLIVLLGSAPLFMVGNIGVLSSLRSVISQVLSVAGARGLLIGVALGTIATGLRILMGVDRPYGG
jgi:hypothetical protein